MLHRILLATTCALSLLPFSRSLTAEEALPNPDRVKQVRALYSKLPSDILKIKEPVTVVDVEFTRIPLASIVILKDAAGQQLFVRRDQGLDTPTPDALFLSRVAPFKQETRLGDRGPEELAVYGLMIRWLEAELKKPYDDRLDRWTMNDVEQFLNRSDRRYTSDPPVEVPDRR
jgi:hypothetical protein